MTKIAEHLFLCLFRHARIFFGVVSVWIFYFGYENVYIFLANFLRDLLCCEHFRPGGCLAALEAYPPNANCRLGAALCSQLSALLFPQVTPPPRSLSLPYPHPFFGKNLYILGSPLSACRNWSLFTVHGRGGDVLGHL